MFYLLYFQKTLTKSNITWLNLTQGKFRKQEMHEQKEHESWISLQLLEMGLCLSF